ncbi:MAG: hypothetical protein ABJC19_04755 [Gemmatimonadota bacterium]
MTDCTQPNPPVVHRARRPGSPTRGRVATALMLLGLSGSALSGQGRSLVVAATDTIGLNYDFTRIAQASIGPAGIVAVAQPNDHQILLFDLARLDTPPTVVGRKGEGPGEFSGLAGIGWIGSTLWAGDWSRPRIEFFDATGKLLRSKQFTPPTSPTRPARYVAPTLVLRGESLIYFPSLMFFPGSETPAGYDPAFPILLSVQGRGSADTIALIKMLDAGMILRGDRGSMVANQPLTPLNILVAGAGGERALLVLQAEPEARVGRAQVRVISATGARIYDRDLGVQASPVSDRTWDSVVTHWVTTSVPRTWSTAALAKAGLAEGLVRPRTSPAVSAALLGQDGRAWIRVVEVRNGMVVWRVLAPSGAEQGTVTLPAGLRLLDAAANFLVGAVSDADGVEHLVRLRLAAAR